MLNAYLTDQLGNCDFDGEEQLYKCVGDKIAKPSTEEQIRHQEIEQVLLTEKIEVRFLFSDFYLTVFP